MTKRILTFGLVFIGLLYTSGLRAQGEVIEGSDSPEVFIPKEKAPEFPGGVPAFYRFMESKLKYPKVARRKGIEGMVMIKFVISPAGKVLPESVKYVCAAPCNI